MDLRVQIDSALAAAQDEQDEVGASTLRLVQCAIRDRDRVSKTADGDAGCEDAQIAQIILQMIRQRDESAESYEQSGRLDMAERERQEAEVLRALVPAPLDEGQVRQLAAEVVEDLEAHGLKDVGRCVAEVKKRGGGAVDGAQAGAAVRDLLTVDPTQQAQP